MSNLTFRTSNGTTYVFEPHPYYTNWNPVGGVYMFGRQSSGHPGGWEIFYVGQTDNFQRRFSNHERWAEAVRRGATHILATVVPTQAARDILERELIQAIQPPMNDQHKSRPW